MALKLKPVDKSKTSKLMPKKDAVSAPKKTLHDIVDRNKLFTIIYSGVENDKYFKLLYEMGIRDFLMSYHYIMTKSKGIDNVKDLGIRLFIDSGAHTYQNDPKYSEYSIDYWENHLKSYLEWAKANKDSIFAIANFDFENMLGADIVNKWNKQYFEPFMLETGIPVCFVWHQNSHTSWDKYCERYPYVGFSSANTSGESIELSEYINKLKVAEKHNSLVHGFGMTQTSLLPKIPYYTVDSTTWLVGLQYGEINFWTGSKMTRLKKEKWKGDYLGRIVSLGIDQQKLVDEDTDEMVRANLHAFIQAEKYIRDRLKSQMYWLKPVAKKVESLDDVEFPSKKWLAGDTNFDNLEEYARRLNINPEHPDREWIISAVIDCTVFCHWTDPSFKALVNNNYINAGILSELHEQYINRICSSDEDRADDLMWFFKDVAMGKNTKLLTAGTNFDLAVKERDNYLEEEEYEYVDASPEEIKQRLAGLLPSPESTIDPAPDITELDDEIYSQADIVPVRDQHGRFLKGQKKVKKPKNIYSDLYPKMACDRCYASQKCVEYKAGMACAYNRLFKRFDTRNMDDLIQAMQSMVGLNLERMQRVAMFEILDGGMPDGNLTNFIDQNARLVSALKQLYESGSPEVLRHTKVVRADGSQEETTQISNPQGGGILEKLFMSQAKPPSDDLVEDITPRGDKPKNERYNEEDRD